MISQKHIRHRLLLDEGLSPKESFSLMNNYHNVRHINHDLKKGGATDIEVYSIAARDERMVVVFNTKDFKPLISGDSASVISLSTNLTETQADLKICKALRELKPSEKKGCLISITNMGINIIKVLKV